MSTVRPNLNAVAVVPAQLDGATASTGFTVLRPSEELDGRFLFHWVQSPAFIADMVRKATGASYPAVSLTASSRTPTIPAPHLPEQRRIATILDHADALRATRLHVLTHLDALTHSIFNDMFADARATSTVEAEAPSLIRTGPFGSQLLHSEFVSSKESQSSASTTSSSRHESSRWGERRFITPAKYEKLQRYTVIPGDVLISIMGTTGRCVVVPDDISPQQPSTPSTFARSLPTPRTSTRRSCVRRSYGTRNRERTCAARPRARSWTALNMLASSRRCRSPSLPLSEQRELFR